MQLAWKRRQGVFCNDALWNGPEERKAPLLFALIQGGTSKDFENIKRMAFTQPDTLHLLLDKLADNIADYCRYQVKGEEGAALDWRQGPCYQVLCGGLMQDKCTLNGDYKSGSGCSQVIPPPTAQKHGLLLIINPRSPTGRQRRLRDPDL